MENSHISTLLMQRGTSAVTVKSVIISEIEDIASEQGKTVGPLKDSLPLLDAGLDPLCFAISRLEDMLGIDPYISFDEVDLPVTFGDFVKLYEDAARQSK